MIKKIFSLVKSQNFKSPFCYIATKQLQEIWGRSIFIVVIYGVESDMDKLNEKIEKRMRLIESSFDLKFIFSEQHA